MSEGDQACLPFLGADPLGPERLDGFHRGDILDQVGVQVRRLLHGLLRPPPRYRLMGHHADDQQGDERRRYQGERPVVQPQHSQQDRHEHAVHHGGGRRPADRLADLAGVVDPRQDLADAARLEEAERQVEQVAGVAGDEGQVHLAADVGEQVLPQGAEQHLEHQHQHHADTEGVEQPLLMTDEDGIDQVLHEVRGGDPQDRHEQGTEDGLDQDRGVAVEQPEEAAPGAARRRVGPCVPVRLGDDQEQVAGPAGAELLAGQLLDAAGRVGDDDGILVDTVQDDKMSQPLGGANVGHGRQRDGRQRLVRPLDGAGGEADLLGALNQAEQVGADAVGAGQLAHLLQADGPTVVQGDRRQRGGTAVALVGLPDESITPEHSHLRFDESMGRGSLSPIRYSVTSDCDVRIPGRERASRERWKPVAPSGDDRLPSGTQAPGSLVDRHYKVKERFNSELNPLVWPWRNSTRQSHRRQRRPPSPDR